MKTFDLLAIKKSNPILDVIGRDVQLRKQGRAYMGLCPFHAHTKKTPSFAVYPDSDTWHCYGKCGEGGDVIKYVMLRDKIDFRAACELLGGELKADAPRRQARPVEIAADEHAPDKQWQATGWGLVNTARDCLWSSEGERALAYLKEQRFLRNETIERWCLGFIPEDTYVPFEQFGLPPDPDKPERKVWIPRGIVIPTFDAYGELWAIHVRRANGEPKYPHIAGSRKALWGSQNIARRAVFVWGGEFDAMLAEQEGAHAGGHCSPTTGEGSHWSSSWSANMLWADVVIVCYDADDAGQKGAWRNVMSATGRAVMAPRFPIEVKDLTDYARAGGRPREWILKLREQFLSRNDDPAKLWERIEANYESREEVPDYYKDLEIDFALSAGGD